MKQYIILIVGAALLGVFADMISPDGWKKYVRIITGLVILSVIISPVAKIKDIDLFAGFDSQETYKEEGQKVQKEAVASEFQRALEEDAQSIIDKEYGIKATVHADVRVNENGEIEEVESLEVEARRTPKELRDRLSYIYGVSPDKVVLGHE